MDSLGFKVGSLQLSLFARHLCNTGLLMQIAHSFLFRTRFDNVTVCHGNMAKV